MRRFEVVVVGAGHAGCEAAAAAARLGGAVALVTLRLDRIAHMSCNPAVGGVGKGHLVREVDALGGIMGRVTDATGIQFRRLNMSRGPAVRSTRAQSDSRRYSETMASLLRGIESITLIEGEVASIEHDAAGVSGVVLTSGEQLAARAVVVTTGTFLNGLCHVGDEKFQGGRVGDRPALHLSASLERLGVRLSRFKTGTTPRLARDTVAFADLEAQHGDHPRPTFSFDEVANGLTQVPCHVTYTTPATREAVLANLSRSPLYQGVIVGRGPRYCPSLEDKFVRFADKERHQIFLEPEGLDSDRIYPNGLSTSLPRDVQDAFLRTIPGLERARVVEYGYAVEYDFAQPTQLRPSLMTKACPGLFLAGQVNGTSGYEEAAAQGLMAGLNAVRFVKGETLAVLGRDQAYIGVLIDDLVTKGVDEPYRVFTSRAEHRLVLRESNAEERLWPLAAEWGLLGEARRTAAARRHEQRALLRKHLDTLRVSDATAKQLGLSALVGESLRVAAKRPEVGLADLVAGGPFTSDAVALVEEEVKYDGYIKREQREIERLKEMESLHLPPDIDVRITAGLSRELREKVARVRPATLGQASRIPGMTPAGLALLRLHAHRAKMG